MNKKGFTVVELITSFTLASIIMIILFNVILIMKDNLSKVNAMTNTLVEKDNLSYNINKRLKEKELSSITTCGDGDKCFLFTYSDSTSDKLVYSSTDKTITFNNYTFSNTDDMSVESPTITEHYDTMSSTKYNGYFIINIPITVDGKDYSIKVNKHFNMDSITIDLTDYQYDTNGNKYTPVEYLESTGSQYINTGFKPNQDTRIETHIYRNKYDKSFQFPFGSRTLAGSNEFEMVFYQAGGGWRDDYGNTENRKFLGYTESTGEFYIDKNKNVTTINDISITHNLVNFQSDYNLTIFGTNQKTGVQSGESDLIKLYSFKLYDNGNIIRDYIPVIDEVNVACLFDKIEKKCYYNQGTGEFLWG